MLKGDSKFVEATGAMQFACDNVSLVLGAVRNLINVFLIIKRVI